MFLSVSLSHQKMGPIQRMTPPVAFVLLFSLGFACLEKATKQLVGVLKPSCPVVPKFPAGFLLWLKIRESFARAYGPRDDPRKLRNRSRESVSSAKISFPGTRIVRHPPRRKLLYTRYPLLVGLDWWFGFGLESLLSAGEWETVLNHQPTEGN